MIVIVLVILCICFLSSSVIGGGGYYYTTLCFDDKIKNKEGECVDPIKFQKLKITSTTGEALTLQEVYIYDMEGKNIAESKTVTSSPIWEDGTEESYLAKNVVDGIINDSKIIHTKIYTNQPTSELAPNEKPILVNIYPWFTIDLGSEEIVNKIEIINRGHMPERIEDATLELLDADNKVVKTETLKLTNFKDNKFTYTVNYKA